MSADVPPDLWLVESFLNSVDVSSGADDLHDVEGFQRWLTGHDRAADGSDLTGTDLRWVRELRAELRHVLRRHHGDDLVVDAPALTALAAPAGLIVEFGPDGAATLCPAGAGVRRFVAEVLAVIVYASAEGTWRRLKLCSAADCEVVYYDTSKNRSRRWCSMRICGNRSKTRAYYQRRTSRP
ncbi:CGNR zinc finger domain-containing protein [Phytoactinopolyspora limicola]|uniref:CGNR zinc finger domain-containing protein n=1 Tax=Phytoactinopolyspora limicola TaxID=2715536 RepID=UPI00140ABBEA|nr:CGNR zinc finger domain-containing protein [Phytoactinopolyspora limicola]